MQKSRLVRILRTFTKKEVRDFRKWLHSPAHNQREDVVAIFEYLVAGDHLEKDELLDKTVVFPHVYPQEPFDDAKIRQGMHFLLKAMEDFLVYQDLLEDEVRSKVVLAKVYRQRQLGKSFKRTMQAARKLQEQQSLRNRHYLQNEYDLQYEEYSYLSGLRRTVPLNLQEVSNSMDVAYLANKLRQSCLMLAHQTVFKTEYEIGLLEEVFKFVENKHYLDVPAIAIYYYAYKATKERDNEEYFQRLKEQIIEHGDLFPQSEIRDIYLLAINYTIGRMNAGVEQYVRETFELYRRGLEKKILIQNGLLSRFTFMNAVINGAMLKEYDWTERFIHEYKDYMEEQYRENVVHYSLARLHYEKKDYATAMRLFSQVEYDDILLNLNAKTLLLKMYYEEDELDLLEALLESMRMYMRRKKVIGYHKANFKNIITITKKLVHVNPYDKTQRENLHKEILETNPLPERKWLLKQVEEIG